MKRSILALPQQPDRVLVDGNQIPMEHPDISAIIKGDLLHQEISAASVVAKVVRDRMMCALASRYPSWQFDVHKGYPTSAHMQALREFGVSSIHRKSFAPVRRVLLEVV